MAKQKGEMSHIEMLMHTDREAVERVFGLSFAEKMAWYMAFSEFNTARLNYIDATMPGLQALQLEHYPLTAAYTEPKALARINDNHYATASSLIWSCRGNLQRMEAGINIHERYPKLEQWRAFYCRDEGPQTINRDQMYIGPNDTEETIRNRMDAENAQFKSTYEQRKKRKDAFYNLMQPLLFQHMPALHQMEGDHWVIYAGTIRDEYEDWKTMCEQFDTTIEYNMPQESITWKYVDWHALLGEKMRA